MRPDQRFDAAKVDEQSNFGFVYFFLRRYLDSTSIKSFYELLHFSLKCESINFFFKKS